MTRLILTLIVLTFAGSALAQQQTSPAGPPNDDEIAAAVASCQKKENFDTIPPKDAQGKEVKFPGSGAASTREYKTEFAAPCKTIEAEHEKRGLAQKAKQQDDLKRIGNVSDRLKK